MGTPPLSVPGKVFLLGEYAVLGGAPAWVASIAPRFTFRAASAPAGFHPESPAGRFLARTGIVLNGEFADPWEGRGGFGGSTAEFAFAAHRAGIRSAAEAWRAYRALTENDPPMRRLSGADLIAQWTGGTIEWDPKTENARDLSDALRGLPVLVFSATHLANRKTVTHRHLETLTDSNPAFDSLSPAFARARRGMRAGDWREVGAAFSAYADSLAQLGLEAPVVRNERLALSRLPGVLGAKGCGSLQTDAMLVVVESLDGPAAASAAEFAERECGLRLIARGLSREPGLREEAS